MKYSARMGLIAVASAMLVGGCTTDPETGNRRLSRAAIGGIGGALGGYVLGDIVGGRRDRTEKIVGAGIGALAGAGIGAYLDAQERKLREQTAGTDVEVVRQGDQILLNVPSGVTFDTNRYDIKPEFRATLDQVASTLAEYDKTFIDIYGHTDSTGSDAINNPLSENRARSVAGYLETKGVNQARIGTRGFGSTQPVADNGTDAGRAANRRVEIRITPITEADVAAS